jgi:hypothetical protein
MSRALMMLTLAALMLSVACGGPSYERGVDDPSIDEEALSTRLDRADLQLALDQWWSKFEGSPFVSGVGSDRPNIAILRISNDTSEHVSGALGNLLNSIETKLVNMNRWNVIDNSALTADGVMAERIRSVSDSVDPDTIAALGKEYGIHYFINGRVGDTAEKTSDKRRVQYYLFLRVTDVATKITVFQEQIDDITKLMED